MLRLATAGGAIVSPIADGCMLAVPREVCGVPMAATRALIRRGVKNLHPVALITNRCLFSFAVGRFALKSVHPGHTVAEVVERTGFDFDCLAGSAAAVPGTAAPTPETLALMREKVAPQLATLYPEFARQVFGGVGATVRSATTPYLSVNTYEFRRFTAIKDIALKYIEISIIVMHM